MTAAPIDTATSRSPASPEAGRSVFGGYRRSITSAPEKDSGGARRALAVLLVVGFLAACDFFTVDSDPAAEARIHLDGDGPSPLEMVTSTAWEPGGTADDGSRHVVLLDADTAEVDVPFEGTFSLGGEDRFFVRVKNLDPETGPTVTMTVFLDDEQFFDGTQTLEGDERLQFTYRLR